MPTIEEVLSNGDFKALPLGEQLKVARGFADFAALPAKEQGTILYNSNSKGKIPTPPPPAQDPGFFATLGKDIASIPQFLSHPITAVEQGVEELGGKAKEAWAKNQPVAALGYGAASMIPIAGPAVAAVGESLGEGHYGEAGARVAELALPFLGRTRGGKMVGTVSREMTKKTPIIGHFVKSLKDAWEVAKAENPPAPPPKVNRPPAARVELQPQELPDLTPIPGELPSGRKVGPVPAPAPRTRTATRVEPISAPVVVAEPIAPPSLASGRKVPTKAETMERASSPVPPPTPGGRGAAPAPAGEVPAGRVGGRAPRPSDEFYETHGQVKKSIRAAADLHAKGVTVEQLKALSPTELKEALGKHSETTFNRILFELRGLETGKIKP